MVNIKLATMDDFEFFYELKCEKHNMWWTGSAEPPKRNNIYSFFKKCIDEQNHECKRKIFIVYCDGIRVGHLYFIPNEKEFDLPVAIAQDYLGNHYASQAIRCGLEYARARGFYRMVVHIREDNMASLKAYKGCGAKVTDNYIVKDLPWLENDTITYRKIKMNEIIIDLN